MKFIVLCFYYAISERKFLDYQFYSFFIVIYLFLLFYYTVFSKTSLTVLLRLSSRLRKTPPPTHLQSSYNESRSQTLTIFTPHFPQLFQVDLYPRFRSPTTTSLMSPLILTEHKVQCFKFTRHFLPLGVLLKIHTLTVLTYKDK